MNEDSTLLETCGCVGCENEKIQVLYFWFEVPEQISGFEMVFTQLCMIEVESTGVAREGFLSRSDSTL